ncbi:glycerol-3-phosphate 1-O-acyltransferase PlsY [Evansella sp. AB-rgal1]|uniref:glycerol-3-phosphate 1-O-acyltransferase PlsY n=1 Tax=Evansella sp. AB-rgal1 TaxID=3242696 RepID=UPI00359D48C6
MIKLATLYIVILAYLIGSIPFALIVGKFKYGADVRDFGSGNLGASNSALVLGKKAGVLVLLGDVSKGVLATSLPTLLNTEVNTILVGVAVILGHCFPIFAGFRGGKAVAPTAGVLLSSSPVMFLTGYTTFFLVVFITKYVFLGSLSIGIALLVHSVFIGEQVLMIVFAIFTLFMVYLHRTNVMNYFNGKEVKINDKRIKKYQQDIKEELSQRVIN